MKKIQTKQGFTFSINITTVYSQLQAINAFLFLIFIYVYTYK